MTQFWGTWAVAVRTREQAANDRWVGFMVCEVQVVGRFAGNSSGRRTVTTRPLPWDDFSTYVDFHRDFLTAAQEGTRVATSVDAVANAFVGRGHQRFEIDLQRVKDNMQAIYDGR